MGGNDRRRGQYLESGLHVYRQGRKHTVQTTGGVTVLTTTVGVTETMGSTGGGQPPWISSIQLDKTTMEAIIAGVAAQLQAKEGESSRTGGKSNQVPCQPASSRYQL